MGELWDAVYSIMWGRKKVDYALPYAIICWRVPEETKQKIRNHRSNTAEYYALDERTDLFIADNFTEFEREDWETRYGYGHYGHRLVYALKHGFYAREELLRQRESSSSKWMYRCEEYDPTGRLAQLTLD